MSRSGARPAGRGRPAGGKRRGRRGDGLETGLETADDGTVIGQDPRTLTPPELREIGHRGKPLLQAMRRRCVDCCGGKADEVRRCTAVACPLWPYRMGTDPWHAEPAKPVVRAEPAAPEPAKPPCAPKAEAATAKPAKLVKAVDDEPAGSARPVQVAPAPTVAPVPRAAGRRRSRRPAEAPLLPFLDDAPA